MAGDHVCLELLVPHGLRTPVLVTELSTGENGVPVAGLRLNNGLVETIGERALVEILLNVPLEMLDGPVASPTVVGTTQHVV